MKKILWGVARFLFRKENGSALLNFAVAIIFYGVYTEFHHERERQCLALNIWHEARGEMLIGQLQVGFVTMNRRGDPRFRDTVCGVVYQKDQFSWTREKPKASYVQVQGSSSDRIARMIYNGQVPDLSNGANHYFATWLHAAGKAPSWHTKMQKVGGVGAHEFYYAPLKSFPSAPPPPPLRKPQMEKEGDANVART